MTPEGFHIPFGRRAVDKSFQVLFKVLDFFLFLLSFENEFSIQYKKKKAPNYVVEAFIRVTSSGETSNFLMEDLERVLQLETLESTIL